MWILFAIFEGRTLCYIYLSPHFQGMLFAGNECCKTPVDLVRLWLHEGERVYRDKLTDEKDMEIYDKMKKDICKKAFEVSTWMR